LLLGLRQQGLWTDQRQVNLLDGGSHWYDCYECADGEYVSVGALEPVFYRELVEKCGLAGDEEFAPQFEPGRWPKQKERMARMFKSRRRDEWRELLEGTDACFAPVLNLSEAPEHPHNRARNTFTVIDDVVHPAPSPRFSRTTTAIAGAPPGSGEHTESILEGAGFTTREIAGLRAHGVI
jgi:alpha-methylacyl-CoA racemase